MDYIYVVMVRDDSDYEEYFYFKTYEESMKFVDYVDKYNYMLNYIGQYKEPLPYDEQIKKFELMIK